MSTKTTISISDLQQQHKAISPKCETLCIEVVRQIDHVVKKEEIRLAVPIQHRAKKWESIYNKVSEGRFNVKKDITELQDLSGLRVITIFQRDALKITELVQKQFKPVKTYRTEDKLNDDQFGYSSIHMIVEVPTMWESVPTLSDLVGMRFEIQIRTLSQHAWAEASNVLQYKQEENVPKPLKRSIGRISALLETVDLELERLLESRKHYITSIQTNAITASKLNVDLLNQLLSQSLPKDNFDKKYNNYSELLEELIIMGIDDSDKLLLLIQKHLDAVLVKDKMRVTKFDKEKDALRFFDSQEEARERIGKGVFYTYTGLVRCMLAEEFGMEWRDLVKQKQLGK